MEDTSKLPDIFGFRPMFTLQPQPETRAKQCDLWHSLLMDFSEKMKRWQIRSTDDIFENRNINRRLKQESAEVILQTLQSSGKCVSSGDNSYWILWRTLIDWGTDIYNYADERGHVGSVCTVFELVDRKDVSWEGMPRV